MNEQQHTSTPVDPAMPATVEGFYDAVSHIEYSLADVRSMAAVASYLAEDMRAGKPDADASVPPSLVDLLTFTVYQTERMLKAVQADWEKANHIGFELRRTA